MIGFKVVLPLAVACVFASSTFAQAPIKKPEKRQQTTTTTRPKPNTNKGSQTKSNTHPNSNSASTSTNTQESNSSTTTTSTTTTTPTPKPTTGTINGHEWVDLGLSVKWATCNVGASSPSDYGNYYAWGETSTKSEYTEENSKTFGKSMGSIAGNPQYDAARANWGSTWRMPTKEEIDELVDKCTWTWTSQGGHNGYKMKGPNGNSIFLPAAGYRAGTWLDYAGENGLYWSATPNEDNAIYAYFLYFSSGYRDRNGYYRSRGLSVRPVTD